MKFRISHICLCLVLWAAILPLAAQPRLAEAEIYVGIHGGVVASTMSWAPKVAGTSRIEQATILGGNGGLVFRYSKHKCCGLQLELDYMQRGWREKIEVEETQTFGYYNRRLDYLELPFLMHIYFGKKSWRGFFNLGPQIGYCLHESSSGVQHPTDTVQYHPLDNPFDWGIAGGVGFYCRTEKAGVFQLEARFNYSLGDAFSNKKSAYFDKSHAMNLSLNLGYFWQIKDKSPTYYYRQKH